MDSTANFLQQAADFANGKVASGEWTQAQADEWLGKVLDFMSAQTAQGGTK